MYGEHMLGNGFWGSYPSEAKASLKDYLEYSGTVEVHIVQAIAAIFVRRVMSHQVLSALSTSNPRIGSLISTHNLLSRMLLERLKAI